MASFEPQDFGLDEPPPRPTTPPVRRGFVLVLLVLTLAAGLVYGIPYVAERTGYAWEAGRSQAALEALAKLDKAGVVDRASSLFRLATVAVSPAVVNIQSQRYRRDGEGPVLPLGGGGGGNRFGRGTIESLEIGSGVIIDKNEGYIVTNNHVIANADEITVRLSHGVDVPARLVGADPKTDLAVIQIKAGVKVAAEWGDSDKLSSGDWVLAIGSPYMLDHTVTAGIVSATGRNNLALPGMDESAYQDFIQTDAAINPGNSGGPLIDLNGKVVGINTAILTANSILRGDEGGGTSGGFEGIGLAIPSSMARKVAEGLIKNGKVVRGYIGVMIQPVTPVIAKELKLPESETGARVTIVQPGGPASAAGLKVGDVIMKLDGKETPDPSALRIRTAGITPGTVVPLELIRDGERRTVNVTIGDLSGPSVPELNAFGFRVREIPPAGGEPQGSVVVDQVVRGSPAARAGLRPRLKIAAVGRTEVHTKAEFDKAIEPYSVEKGLPLLVQSTDGDGQTALVTIGGPRGGPRR
jgi:serine protease Do